MHTLCFGFRNPKAIYDCPFVHFVDALLQWMFCCMYGFGYRGDTEVINEQIVINSNIQAIGNGVDFYVREGY